MKAWQTMNLPLKFHRIESAKSIKSYMPLGRRQNQPDEPLIPKGESTSNVQPPPRHGHYPGMKPLKMGTGMDQNATDRFRIFFQKKQQMVNILNARPAGKFHFQGQQLSPLLDDKIDFLAGYRPPVVDSRFRCL